MNQTLEHVHKDIEEIKNDLFVIKHILVQEGKLKVSARKLLEEARNTPDSEYVSHEQLKKRITQ